MLELSEFMKVYRSRILRIVLPRSVAAIMGFFETQSPSMSSLTLAECLRFGIVDKDASQGAIA